MVRRASDLTSKWVGETEQRIASAFAAAERDHAVLLIDEADSLISSRQRTSHQWEVSQINEMLTQMEAFTGVFIASTNLIEHLDAASLRRFDFKLRFDPPNPLQRQVMVRASHAALNGSGSNMAETQSDTSFHAEINRLHDLTPGDIAVVRRQCEIAGERPDLERWIGLLHLEVQAKRQGAKAGIGFML